MASQLTPLQHNVKIVNDDGTPTPYLIQLLQQLYEEKAITDALAAAAVPDTRILTAGAGLTGGGDLTADRVFDVGAGVGISVAADSIAVDTQAVLNQITSVQGSILYRGASLWSALAPGTAGYVLTTGGASADPSWTAGGGGGTGTAWSSITGTPTTLGGYGITDAAPSSHVGAGGGAHAIVVAAGAAGFMSGADKTKLDGVAAGATANSTDAFLLARANHTGTQAVATITGLGYFATGTDAANLTGTIAAAQTPAYTGDVSSAAGSLTMTIGAHKVTRGMMVQTAGAAILGATAAGDVADLTAAQAKTFLAITAADVAALGYFATGANAANLTGTLAVAQMPATTGGDVSNAAGGFTLTIGANKVTRAMLAQTASATILGATAAGNVADLTAAQAKTFLAIVAGDVGGLGYFAAGTDASNLTGTVAAARIAANSLALGKLAQIANNRILGNVSGAAGDPAELTAAQVKTMIAVTFTDVGGTLAASQLPINAVGGADMHLNISGLYVDTQPIPASSTVVGAANRVIIYPWTPSRDTTIAQIGIEITSGVVSATSKIIVYDSDATTGGPNNLIKETAPLDCASNLFRSEAWSYTFLKGVRYWLGVRSSSTATLRGYSVSGLFAIGRLASTGSSGTYLLSTLTYATGANNPYSGLAASQVTQGVVPSISLVLA